MPEIKGSNSFYKGMVKDYNELNQPQDTYVKALNFVNLSDKGDIVSLTNEKGTLAVTNLPTGFQLIGHFVLEKDIITVHCSNTNSAVKIGIIDHTGTYNLMLDDINNELNLDLDHPLSCQARVLINNDRILYFADNKSENFVKVINLDDPPAVGKISKQSDLVLKADFPIITDYTIQTGSGNIKCGSYQFVFRYISNTGNISNVSLPTNPVGIGQGINPSNDTFQGGYSNINTGNVVNLSITDLDTDYERVQIIAIAYDVDNVIYAYVTGDVSVPPSGTLEFVFKAEELQDITTNEVLGITTNYASAKTITQKDGRLFISNLRDATAAAEEALKQYATTIKLDWDIVSETSKRFYKDPFNNTERVGYKRGEVYAYSFGVIYKNGAKSFAYHIPNTNGGNIDVFTSTAQYPSDYASLGLIGGIKHFKMPTCDVSAPYTGDVNNLTINILHIVPTFNPGFDYLLDGIRDKIQGFFIARRTRDDDSNKSIFSQGIGNFMMDRVQTNTDEDEESTGSTTLGGNDFKLYPSPNFQLCKSPLMGGIKLGDYLPQDGSGGWSGEVNGSDGIQTVHTPNQGTYLASPWTTGGNTMKIQDGGVTVTGDNGDRVSAIYSYLLSYHSPESELLPKLEIDKATFIRKIGNCDFNLISPYAREDHSVWSEGPASAHRDSGTKTVKNRVTWFATESVSRNYTVPATPVNLTDQRYVDRNSIVTTSEGVVNNERQESFLMLFTTKGSDSLSLVNGESTLFEFNIRNSSPVDDGAGSTPFRKNIFELISNNPSQYGEITNNEYVLCKYYKYDQTTTPSLSTYNGLSSSRIFGGDTYVCRYSFTNKTALKVKGFWFKAAGTNVWRYATEAHPDTFGREFTDIRCVSSYVVESFKNVDLRHELSGGNVFKWRSSDYNVLFTNPQVVDDTKSYNNQYDFENRLQLFFSPSSISGNSNFKYKTRTIWSDQTILGELRDRYRDLRVNNFYDLPFNTGEIWNNFVYNNILYLHTPKTLWKTFVNAISQSASSSGEVTLGTGGVFPVELPPQQIMTIQGGYAGTISQWAGCLTPIGYIFPDRLQGKVFLLQENLKEITTGLVRYFNDNLTDYDIVDDTYLDNPFKVGSEGLLSGYDYENRRYILSKNSQDSPLTISFNTLSNVWLSEHSYYPNYLISIDNKLFSGINSTEVFYRHNKGDYGNFYGDVYPSILKTVLNNSDNPKSNVLNDTKVFDTSVLLMTVVDPNNNNIINPLRGAGDTIQLYNDRCNTGIIDLVYTNTYGALHSTRNEVLVKFKNNEYRLALPLNSITNGNLPQSDVYGNVINNNLDTNTLHRERIKGKYSILELSFDNTQNLKMTINSILTTFRLNYR